MHDNEIEQLRRTTYRNLRNLHKERMYPSRGDIYIGRPSLFGNPYKITKQTPRESAINKFRDYAREKMRLDPDFREAVKNLHGKRLFCFCAPAPCHGEVLILLCEELNR